MAEKIPTLKWAQRREKVFVTFECVGLETCDVTFAEGLLSINAKDKASTYKLENMSLWMSIEVEESKWFKNDRCARARARETDRVMRACHRSRRLASLAAAVTGLIFHISAVRRFARASAVVMSLKKKDPEWWDGLTKDKTYKKLIKCDFSKFCEEVRQHVQRRAL